LDRIRVPWASAIGADSVKIGSGDSLVEITGRAGVGVVDITIAVD
jgi:hypothetical protein